MVDDAGKNSILRKFKRNSGTHMPSGKADVFFGDKQPSKIVEVTKDVIRYIDNMGEEKELKFDECKQAGFNLVNKSYIANRAMLSSPPSIEFFNNEKTVFEFQTRKLAYELLSELSEVDVWTIDID